MFAYVAGKMVNINTATISWNSLFIYSAVNAITSRSPIITFKQVYGAPGVELNWHLSGLYPPMRLQEIDLINIYQFLPIKSILVWHVTKSSNENLIRYMPISSEQIPQIWISQWGDKKFSFVGKLSDVDSTYRINDFVQWECEELTYANFVGRISISGLVAYQAHHTSHISKMQQKEIRIMK